MDQAVFLLAEDSDTDALLVRMEVSRHEGVHLVWVKDGQAAIDYLMGEGQFNDREEYPLPDMILLDLKMPRLSGFDFLKWRREEAPEELRVIPVIVMSGSDLQQDVRRAYALGANCYMTKPGNLDVLRRRISLMIENWCEHTELVEHGALREMPSARI